MAFWRVRVILPARCGFAHKNSSSDKRQGRLSREVRIICSQVNIVCSHRGGEFSKNAIYWCA